MRLTSLLVFVGLCGLLPNMAHAEIKTQWIDYQQAGLNLQGYLAYDDAISGKRPGVLIGPEWWGLTEYPRHRAEQLAKLGYIAFALDMYGKGVIATTADQAGKLMNAVAADRNLVRQRALAGLSVLRAQPQCDTSKIAAIGYCFGGMVALELARSGADLSAVVSFHGNLTNPHPENDQPIKPKILICTGADDAFVPPDQIAAFTAEMKAANADFQIITYSGAVHAFTNPDVDKLNLPNIHYNAAADRRSFAAMQSFFNEVFQTPPTP
jgi:dienelactone hydrolase